MSTNQTTELAPKLTTKMPTKLGSKLHSKVCGKLSTKLSAKLSNFLIWAVKAEQTHLINLSALCCANLNTCDQRGKSLVYLAVQTGNPQLLHLLLRNGAAPNACDRFGETPLHFAAKWGDVLAVNLLLAAGADPNFANDNMLSTVSSVSVASTTYTTHTTCTAPTPFWTAVAYQQEAVIAQMLRGGNVNVNYVNGSGVSLIEYVVAQKNAKITALIREYIRREAFTALYVARELDENCIVYKGYLCRDLFGLILDSILL